MSTQPIAPAALTHRVHPFHALHCDGTPVDGLADILRRRTASTPEQIAFLDERGGTTFADLDARASQVAQALLREGVLPGDRVAYIGGNAPSFLEVLNGAARIGALANPVNNRLRPDEVGAILADAEPTVVVLGAGDSGLAPAAQAVPSVRRVVTIDGAPDTAAYEAWIGAEDPVDPGYACSPHDPIVLFYTSGTTGRPKGIMLSGDNIGQALATTREEIVLTTESVAMAPIPYFHIAGLGLALAAQLSGSTLLLEQAASVEGLVDLLVRARVTHAVLVPAVLQAILNAPVARSADWSALEYVVYGAAPIPLPVIQQATEVMSCNFIQSYGLTESTGGVTLLSPADHLPDPEHVKRLTSAGRALPGISLRVVDPDTLVDVPAGMHGEILIRGGQVMLGYWRRPEETAEVLLPGGWFRTGDGGSLDQEGYLYLHDRLKDMIITGGENVFPAEVESVLTVHPAVAGVAVVGVPSQQWGESPYAVVVRTPGAELSEADLLDWARERLAHFKCPVGVSFVEALPRTASGKLLKAQLRRDLADDALLTQDPDGR